MWETDFVCKAKTGAKVGKRLLGTRMTWWLAAWPAYGAVSVCPHSAGTLSPPQILLTHHSLSDITSSFCWLQPQRSTTTVLFCSTLQPGIHLLPLAHIPCSDSQWHLSLLLIHYPSILASRGLLVALATWHKQQILMVNPETLYGGVISWFWLPLHFCSAEAKNTSKKWVWQRAPTLNSLHSN